MSAQGSELSPREQLAHQLAESVAAALREDLAVQQRALLVVSGGSTPVPFFHALSRQSLEWQRVDVTLADERWVAADADDANARLVREHLLVNHAQSANFVSLTTDHATPEQGAEEVAERLAGLSWPASVVILGMGGDGHTASLFPDSRELDLALSTDALTVAVRTPSQPQARITLSAERLHHARRHVLHLTGDDKRSVLASAMAGDDVRELPIRAFLSCPLAVYWAP
ncbi:MULTISPECIES: 6-phosphogluconolactonase [Halomonas]|uniref:6-phosphogluconolactonase n=1 Tax=Halomonas TaxID=2745 RepID=UPI001C97BAE2|nr:MULTISPECIES: 6-phosphogluconolactonase [Halomonas]MBY5929769.1 6-phosphogluconolactonase [Halomonas sp. DP8Y7-3]MBY6207714.1 6-phosphogluconolactonase [Halomonas sp. DP3Y7-2]MBY6228523.1 6-phosphogluconolactonase [Halomonas sp. DP3Y7-1]MCA0916589.1 6-phosphogluconolactonase [Halomonas denitrificans]